MIDVAKQIEYWIQGAEENLEAAEILLAKEKILESLFFAHLTIEKSLKALVVNKPISLPHEYIT